VTVGRFVLCPWQRQEITAYSFCAVPKFCNFLSDSELINSHGVQKKEVNSKRYSGGERESHCVVK
jgi:hypothetical protein